MTIDERKRAELILSPNAEPTEAQWRELRTHVDTLAALVKEDRPDGDQVVIVLKNALRIFRPLTGREIQRLADDKGRLDA